MVSTSELSQALTLVQSIRPVAIILDILMSDMDGWSILQALQLRSDIAEIPVIVCSVISDPQLASALGASASLSKPLSRLELLGVLKQFASSRTWA